MAQQTINVGAAPNDGTGTPLRTAFQYTNSNFTELYTAVGPSGNNIVVPGSATITGDLTVDTSTLKVDSANNRVGIGTASPAAALVVNLPEVSSAAGTSAIISNTTGGGNRIAALRLQNLTNQWNIRAYGSVTDDLRFGSGSAGSEVDYLSIGNTGIFTWSNVGGVAGTAMTLNSTGLGVGVVPSATNSTYFQALEIARVGQGLTAAKNVLTGSPSSWLSNNSYATYSSGVVWNYAISQPAAQYRLFEGQHQWFNAPSGTAGNAITFTQAMTLDASGNLLVGTTTTSGNAGGLKLSNVGGTLGQITFSNNSGSADYVARFNYGSTPTLVGTITVDSGGTTYNTTSDYRLKESVQPLVGGLARVSALKPSIYKWKSDGSSGEGFLAHELAEVVPFAVSGEKDAVNEDGSVKAQGVDLSRVVPILVAAIQELAAEVNALKNA